MSFRARVGVGRGQRPEHRLAIADVSSWQVFPEMGFDVVAIELATDDTCDGLTGMTTSSAFYGESQQTEREETVRPNPNALHLTRPSRQGCNPTPSWAGSLSLGRSTK